VRVWSSTNLLGATRGEPAVYQIKVKGQLSADWRAWFDGMTITQDATGATLITGPLADQAALHGLLRKVRDLGDAARSALKGGVNSFNQV
jgi:hypothetical protein